MIRSRIVAHGVLSLASVALTACDPGGAAKARNEETQKAMLESKEAGHRLIRTLKQARADVADNSVDAERWDREIGNAEARSAEFDAWADNADVGND